MTNNSLPILTLPIMRWDVIIAQNNSDQLIPIVYVKPTADLLQQAREQEFNFMVEVNNTGSMYDKKSIVGTLAPSCNLPNCRPNFCAATGYYIFTLKACWYGYPKALGDLTIVNGLKLPTDLKLLERCTKPPEICHALPALPPLTVPGCNESMLLLRDPQLLPLPPDGCTGCWGYTAPIPPQCDIPERCQVNDLPQKPGPQMPGFNTQVPPSTPVPNMLQTQDPNSPNSPNTPNPLLGSDGPSGLGGPSGSGGPSGLEPQPQKFACLNGTCSPSQSGIFGTLMDCQSSCTKA
jgi:hypothetical protein